jgi:outer membrane protein assembly factor BamC
MSGTLIYRIALASLLALAVAGCSTIREGRQIDYKSSKTLPPLEVPPDLQNVTSTDRGVPAPSAGTGISTVREQARPDATAAVLPVFADMRLMRDHNARWLVVKGDPETLWLKVREFLSVKGLLIASENPRTGIIETDWAENRAKVGTGSQRTLAKWLGSLYSTGTRDRFRVVLERGQEAGMVNIVIAHQGMEEVVNREGNTGASGDIFKTIWQRRESEPALELEMLRLLMVYLGANEDVARQAVAQASTKPSERAHLTKTDKTATLRLEEDIDRAWRRVGISLDRGGFTVEDRDRSKWTYYIRYVDPDRKTKKARDDELRVSLRENGQGTSVEILDREGAPAVASTRDRILGLLYEQLK